MTPDPEPGTVEFLTRELARLRAERDKFAADLVRTEQLLARARIELSNRSALPAQRVRWANLTRRLSSIPSRVRRRSGIGN